MAWTQRWTDRLARFRAAARRELLRDSTVILFERDGGGARGGDVAGSR
ncbi:hypothetical protein JQK15_18870 [Sphingobium sp. BHU LFT2]|nr:hypothetical protein [Sphingobium sp. BHU LFT2]MBT2245591.1 hypothetical protein [Sphingobium sp. BHU LFT2]